MAWNEVDSTIFLEGDYGRYKRMFIPGITSRLVWAVSLEPTSDGDDGRLRSGFYYPMAVVDGRELFGPSEEMARGTSGQPRGLFMLNWAWLGSDPELLAAVEDYAAVIAPDRGLLPCVASLWGYV